MQTRIQKSKPGPKNPNKVVSTIDNPSDAVMFDRECMGNQSVVRCPVCGENYTHVQAVYTLLGGDESGGLYQGSNLVSRETDYRRDALTESMFVSKARRAGTVGMSYFSNTRDRRS